MSQQRPPSSLRIFGMGLEHPGQQQVNPPQWVGETATELLPARP
jgi:hypothetical protein